MWQAFIGSEAVRDGTLTRGQLRWRYTAVHPGVYLPNGAERSLSANTVAAWLWTGRGGIVAGRAAAALHGALWVDDHTPVELIAPHTRPRPGIVIHEDRISPGDICHIGELPVTTPARTALDIARWLPRDAAVRHLDALARATGIDATTALALAERYPHMRGIRRAHIALSLMDAGAQSSKETWLRLLLIDDGYQRPRTQLPVTDGASTAYIDLGWEEPKIGLDYEGGHHLNERRTYVNDIGRYAMIDGQGWIDLRVVAEHSRRFILYRVRNAFLQRGLKPPSSA